MSEKTEQPTARRLREARKQGQVAVSKDLTTTAVFVGLYLVLWFGAKFIHEHLNAIVERAVRAPEAAGAESSAWMADVQSIVSDAAWAIAPLLLGVVAIAVLIGAMQTRGVFSLRVIAFKFERINPAAGLQNLFSIRQLPGLAKMLFYVLALASALAWCLLNAVDEMIKLVYAPADDLAKVIAHLLAPLFGTAIAAYVMGALLDTAIQRHQFMKQQRMSLEEVRREYRDDEGDPHLKAQRRADGRELIFGEMADRAAGASVVIANPTHVCVALYYVPGKTRLPRVVAKGMGGVAQRMRAAAKKKGVPIIEDPPLARRLYRDVALDHYITRSLIEPTAAVFRWARQATSSV